MLESRDHRPYFERVVAVAEGELTFGGAAQNAVVLVHPTVSRGTPGSSRAARA